MLQSLTCMVTFSSTSQQYIEDLNASFTVSKFRGSEPVLVVHYVLWVLLILVVLLESRSSTLLIPYSVFQSSQSNPFTFLQFISPRTSPNIIVVIPCVQGVTFLVFPY